MTLRTSNLLAGTLLALAASASYAAAQDAPTCACAVPVTVGSAPLGSLTEVSGSVMVTQAAGYVAAQEGTGLLPGSRVVLGADASATLRVGQDCALDLLPNSTATLLSTGQHLCVQVAAPQRAARSSTLVSPVTMHGQSTQGGDDDSLPLAIFGTAAAASAIGALLDDHDDDRRRRPVSD
jgi:hypothetical protein